MDIVKVFGTNLRKYRTNLGLSQEAFAEKCGLHRTYISSVERFQRNISIESIQRIADALEIETYKLFLEESILIIQLKTPILRSITTANRSRFPNTLLS